MGLNRHIVLPAVQAKKNVSPPTVNRVQGQTRPAKAESGVPKHGHCVGNKRGRGRWCESTEVGLRNSFRAFSEFNGLMDCDQMAARDTGTGIKQTQALRWFERWRPKLPPWNINSIVAQKPFLSFFPPLCTECGGMCPSLTLRTKFLSSSVSHAVSWNRAAR